MNKIIFRIGMVLAVLSIFIAPAIAGANTAYFVPQSSSADPGEIAYVEVWVNITDPYGNNPSYSFQSVDVNVTFDPSIGNIISCVRVQGDPWDDWGKHQYGDSWWVVVESYAWGDEPYGLGPGVYPVANLTIEGVNPGVMDLIFSHESPRICNMFDPVGQDYPNQTWEDGTFTCGDIHTFTKDLPEGWNLISLPLTPVDNTTDTVLSGVTKNAVKQYNAATKQFEDATTMDPGTGYFVHVTTAGTWQYVGTPESSTTTQLKSGLNMIGVPNCGMSVSDAMETTDYRYAARWNATSQNYEVHNPNAPTAFHGFDTMEPGEGYFVSAKLDYTPWGINCPP